MTPVRGRATSVRVLGLVETALGVALLVLAPGSTALMHR